MNTTRAITASASLIFAVAACAPAAGQSFTLIPGIQGNDSRVDAITPDGLTAVGSSATTGNRRPGFRWTAAGGREDFGLEAGLPRWTRSRGVSSNGLVIVGEALEPAPGSPSRPFVWSGPGVFRTLDVLPGYWRGAATGVGNNGMVVGNSMTQDGILSRAFRWTPSEGLQAIPFTRAGHSQNTAAAISRDGNFVVGYSFGGTQDAYLWSAATGTLVLPPLTSDPFSTNGALGVNHDGSIVVGGSSVGNLERPVIWRHGLIQEVGLPAGFHAGFLTGVNDAGTVAIGSISGPGSSGNVPAIWTSSRGLERFTDYLAFHGVSVPGNVNLYELTGISADGNTICGFTLDFNSPDPIAVGFLVTIPAPGTVALGAAAAILAVRRRRMASALERC